MSKFKTVIVDRSFFVLPKGRHAQCYECALKFKIGDEVQLKVTSGKRRYYHVSCWEKKLY